RACRRRPVRSPPPCRPASKPGSLRSECCRACHLSMGHGETERSSCETSLCPLNKETVCQFRGCAKTPHRGSVLAQGGPRGRTHGDRNLWRLPKLPTFIGTFSDQSTVQSLAGHVFRGGEPPATARPLHIPGRRPAVTSSQAPNSGGAASSQNLGTGASTVM